MEKCKVTFLPDGRVFEVAPGTTVFDAALGAGVYIDSPCGGNGSCGKCSVNIVTEDGSRPALACRTKIEGDMTVILPQKGGHRILTQGVGADFNLEPFIYRDDSGAVYYEDEVIGSCEEGMTLCAMAFDIGTTTVVGYLLDVETGDALSTISMLNPQSKFGADVISRANYAVQNGGGIIAETIRKALSELIEEAVKEAGIKREQIFLVTVVGNTCMHHLFLGIPAKTLILAPYRAAAVEPMRLVANDYGLGVNENAVLLTLPNISGFVGADTVGAILSSGIDREEKLSLLIDIGTNGEMVLGNKFGLCACSTAAGPAFEGAKISRGMRAAAGAIDHADFSGGEVRISVIGGGEAKGICGSGLIDIVAELLKLGIIDETGRFAAPEAENGDARELMSRLEGQGGQRLFRLTDDVCVTQRDIREVQLAKAAVAAGIELLLRKKGVNAGDVERVLLAGAFGNYMSPKSACSIGLIPKELEGKIVPVGNAAGRGAIMAALSKSELKRAAEIGKNAEYLELAGMPEFNEVFADKMGF